MTGGLVSVTEVLKDLDGLSSVAMLRLCELWLQDADIRTHLGAHDLGIAIHARLLEAYQQLVELRAPLLGFELRQLGLSLRRSRAELDQIATRLHIVLKARTEVESDSETAEHYRELMGVLFPRGPGSLVSLSRRMTGTAELDHARDDSAVTRLQSVPVTITTLAEAYRAWKMVEDAIEQRRQARTHIHPLLDADSRLFKSTKRARSQWLKTARALFSTVALLPLSERARNKLLASLERSVVDMSAAMAERSPAHLDQPTRPDFPRPDAAGAADQAEEEVDDTGEDTLDFDPVDLDGLDDLFVSQ